MPYTPQDLPICAGLVLLGFSLIFIAKFLTDLIFTRTALSHVPGPKSPSVIFGEEWRLYHTSPGSLYLDWHKQFGRVVKFSGAFGHQVLSVTDPRAITYILGEGIYNFPKPHGVRAWFRALLGDGILWVEGKDAHEQQRRILAPALSQQSVRALTPLFYETSAKLAAQWSRMLDLYPYKHGAEIEVTNWAGRFALDTVGLAAFSYDFGSLSGKPHQLAETLDGLTNNENSLSSFYMRALFWIFPSILSIGKKGEMIRQTKKQLGDVACRMWRDAKIVGDTDGKSLMALMLKADAANSLPGQGMNEEHIVSQMRTVISAGYEPVSAIIAWVLYELAINPTLQRDLRDEISTAGDPTFDELNNKFPLLNAVLNETLRIHPPILENHHVAAETISVPLSDPLPGTVDMSLVIPKGTIISIPVNVVSIESGEWGLDAHLFRPQRWLERKKDGGRMRRDIFAFSEGPRTCIGRAFAVAEIKALTVILLRQFSFACPYDIEAFQSFVIRPRIKGQGPSSLPLLVRRV